MSAPYEGDLDAVLENVTHPRLAAQFAAEFEAGFRSLISGVGDFPRGVPSPAADTGT